LDTEQEVITIFNPLTTTIADDVFVALDDTWYHPKLLEEDKILCWRPKPQDGYLKDSHPFICFGCQNEKEHEYYVRLRPSMELSKSPVFGYDFSNA